MGSELAGFFPAIWEEKNGSGLWHSLLPRRLSPSDDFVAPVLWLFDLEYWILVLACH